jgi:uncharacterized protein YjbK
MGLQLQGELITERCYILRNSTCELVLDRNNYLGYTDYELEVEYSKDNESDAISILNFFLDMLNYTQADIKKRLGNSDHISSKSQRFFEIKNLNYILI